MKRVMLIGAALTGMALALVTPAHADGDAARGKTKAISCMGCHGIPGYHNAYPNYPVPRVGGQYPEYIVAALKAYKSGQRRHPTMQAQAATLDDQDMQDIAAYFATAPAQ